MLFTKLLVVLSLVSVVKCALVQAEVCKDASKVLNLDKMLIDVAIDTEHKKLKFFLNSKILSTNMSDINPIIDDVNSTTNRFTTFHATIWFMGKVIADENKRFCDIIGVKNTSEYLQSPRFETSTNTTIVVDPDSAFEVGGTLGQRDSVDGHLLQGNVLQEETLNQLDFDLVHDSLNNVEASLDKWDSSVPETLSGKTSLNQRNLFDDPNEQPHHHHWNHTNGSRYDGPFSHQSFANSNKTIDELYSNSTGQWISCPLYVNDSIYIYYEVDIGDQVGKLGSYSARFAVVSNDAESELIGCNTTYVTPSLKKSVARGLLYAILSFIILTGVINFLTVVFSSYQEATNPFLFIASTICNENLLKQLDATVQRIILYLQFALFTAGLNLNFPGFYQPVLSLTKWIALYGINIISGNEFSHSTEQDNIYLTYNADGLHSLSYFGSYNSLSKNWWNFILTFIIWVSIQIGGESLFVGLNTIRKLGLNFPMNLTGLRSVGKRLFFFFVGVLLNNFLILFAYPFLISTMFLFYISAESKDVYFPNVQSLRSRSFIRNVSYDELFDPFSYTQMNLTKLIHSNGTLNTSETCKLPAYIIKELNQTIGSNSTNSTGMNYTYAHPQLPSNNLKPTIVVAAVVFAIWIFLSGYFVFKYLFSFTKSLSMRANKNVTKLYTSVNTLLVWSFYYHHYVPSKNNFVIAETVLLFLRSVVISLMQASGLAQVICMIIIEAVNIALIFIMKPYYLRMTWTTTRWMIPFAKLLVTILCIPFLRELDCSETNRSIVALAHFCVHLLIAVAFLCQLVYCVSTTVISIVKFDRQRRLTQNSIEKLPRSDSADEFNQQFEYQPINLAAEPKAIDDQFGYNEADYKGSSNTDTGYNNSFRNSEDRDSYYRSNAEYRLRNQQSDLIDISSMMSDNHSFKKQQEFSNQRRQQNDYTKREGDLVYKKYFYDEDIDPEIQALWDSRNIWNGISTGKEIETNKSKLVSRKKSCKVRKKKEPEIGFQVSRPRPLVVKVAKQEPMDNRQGSDTTTVSSFSSMKLKEDS